jgi:hypothetical protein
MVTIAALFTDTGHCRAAKVDGSISTAAAQRWVQASCGKSKVSSSLGPRTRPRELISAWR